MLKQPNVLSDYMKVETPGDLLREKGPTAVKRRFKTQLTAFCRKMLCNIFTFASQPQLNAFQSRKKEKNAVNLILLI